MCLVPLSMMPLYQSGRDERSGDGLSLPSELGRVTYFAPPFSVCCAIRCFR